MYYRNDNTFKYCFIRLSNNTMSKCQYRNDKSKWYTGNMKHELTPFCKRLRKGINRSSRFVYLGISSFIINETI